MITEPKKWNVYKHTSPSGKVYIGIAKDIKHRWRANGNGYKGSTRFYFAIQKYGWENFKHEILFTELTQREAEEKEIQLIKKYNSTNILYGYNMESGGHTPKVHEETRKKLHEINLGHSVSKEVRDKLSEFHSIPIICIETNKIYPNSDVASKETNICRTSILKCVKGKQSNAGGLHFAKLKDYENNTIPTFNPCEFGKPIKCVETNTIYKNACEASRMTGINRRGISYACNGKFEKFMGYHWCFASKEEVDDLADIQKQIKESGE